MSASSNIGPSAHSAGAVRVGQIVDKEGSYGFRSFTFPAYRSLLDFAQDAPPCAVLSAQLDGEPAGLLVARLDPDQRQAEILSIVASPDMRRLGVARALMAAAEQVLVARGVEQVSFKFAEDTPARAALDALIARFGFDAPRVRSRQFELLAEKTIQQRWIRERRLPSGYEVMLWRDLPAEIVAKVENADPSLDWVTPYLHPRLYIADYEPNTSFAMLKDGVLRAWTLNHGLGDILRFTCAYAHPEQQRGAWITVLFRRTVLAAMAHGWERGSWTIDVDEPRFFEFAERYMRSGAERVASFLETQKTLVA